MVLVHCRVGSLEIDINTVEQHTSVHCRVGSLERAWLLKFVLECVHCRVGCIKFARSIFNVLLWLIWFCRF